MRRPGISRPSRRSYRTLGQNPLWLKWPFANENIGRQSRADLLDFSNDTALPRLFKNAQAMAAHESPRTTKLYDRTGDEITLDEVERITI
jgi:hypothetical protein